MTALLLRYRVAEKDLEAVLQAVETAFTALKHEHPEGIRFIYYRVAETPEFVGLVELRDGLQNPLLKSEAARALKSVVDRVAIGGGPAPQAVQVIGSYNS